MSSFRTPLRSHKNSSSSQQQQQQQQQQQCPAEPSSSSSSPVPPPAPSSWRKFITERWVGAPASSFFTRQRSFLPNDDDGGGGGNNTTTTQRSNHLRSLLLRQVLSRRILSSYDEIPLQTSENDISDDIEVVDDIEDQCHIPEEENGVEVVALTPRTFNHSGSMIQSYTICRIAETNEFLGEDDYTVDYVEHMRRSVVSEEAISQRLKYVHSLVQSSFMKEAPLEVKLYNVTIAKHSELSPKIRTVYNSSCLYPIMKRLKFSFKGDTMLCHHTTTTPTTGEEPSSTHHPTTATKGTKYLLQNINLCLTPGTQYLVLGAPGSGKTCLLKAIAGLLPTSNITYNDRALSDGDYYIRNAVAYIDSHDLHATRLTVYETLAFAYQCLHGGGGGKNRNSSNNNNMNTTTAVQLALATLGLEDVKDSYVGGDTAVRGISGGQRRRVTTGELLMSQAPVLCGDEITTGLDASAAYDMLQVILHYSRLQKQTKIFALLQPSPEMVSLFDEIIVLCESQIIYSGRLDQVERYFMDIGYRCPEFMDIADFLTMVGNCPDHFHNNGVVVQKTPNGDGNPVPAPPPNASQLAELFRQSPLGRAVCDNLAGPSMYVFTERETSRHSIVSKLAESRFVNCRYANPFYRSTYLIAKRFLMLYIRDHRVIIAGAVKNILMGVSVGGVFFSTMDALSIHGALFQAGLFIMLGSMQSSTALLKDRLIFYKHTDASFYSAWPFAFGRMLSQIPQILFDTTTFSTILYFMIGLADRKSAVNFFAYLGILIGFAILMNAQMNFFASVVDTSKFQVYSACTLLLMMLFGGFIIPPSVIPVYYIWLHWWNPFAWAYRALIVNEFRSERWDNPNQILHEFGFTSPTSGQAYGTNWLVYAAIYISVYIFVCIVFSALGLSYIRHERDEVSDPAENMDRQLHTTRTDGSSSGSGDSLEMPFTPVTVSFKDLSYVVTSTSTKEPLKLLQNVNGILRPGRMCALMGSSGAGKTTLMDVIALRKRAGVVTGEVRLNGWKQESSSFRRCSGYVEQFDVQSPELTVRETVLFSSRLRLDPSMVESENQRNVFIEAILEDVELTSMADALVGDTDESGGLSFGQRKRLSIAVELAASPSILFLDEPTSGLESRGARLVVKTLRRIADGNRTICATIHQPSASVFNMFDDLLLLKSGGQVVYHGPLGREGKDLIQYFESLGAEPIGLGENAANWMLRVMTTEWNNTSINSNDLVEIYRESSLYQQLLEEMKTLETHMSDEKQIVFDSSFATDAKKRREQINARLRTIYWRSPAYNLARIMVSLVIAFVLGSVFLLKRDATRFDEWDMRARLSIIFMGFIITGIMAILSVLPVITKIRDMYYRHADAGMYDSVSIGLALGVAEKWFIVLSTVLFCVVFLVTSGMMTGNNGDADRSTQLLRPIAFWAFFTFNFAIYSYMGQLFVCLVQSPATAIILCSVFIGINNFFSGLIVRPQFLTGFYAIPYFICPGRYVYESMVVAVYHHNNHNGTSIDVDPTITMVDATLGSEFFDFLVSDPSNGCHSNSTECSGTMSQFITVFFGGKFDRSNTLRNALVLGFILTLTRFLSWMALRFVRFAS